MCVNVLVPSCDICDVLNLEAGNLVSFLMFWHHDR